MNKNVRIIRGDGQAFTLRQVCQNVARNFYPVAQKLTISISRCGRGDPESYCASGPSVECFDEP